MQTAERSTGLDPSEHVIYNRCLFAYEAAAGMVEGNIIELGSGEGYGMRLLAPLSAHYLALDKFDSQFPKAENIEFRKMTFPSLEGIQDNSFDYAVTFQVIEHIKNDSEFVKEIHRVLKPGGTLLATTPNRLMSLTRNPWHIREYTPEELRKLMEHSFSSIEMKGVYGNETVMEYHTRNKTSVAKITRFDVFKLQYRLPRQLLKLPFDLLNRMNRRKLLSKNTGLVHQVSTSDFFIADASDSCFDLFVVATK